MTLYVYIEKHTPSNTPPASGLSITHRHPLALEVTGYAKRIDIEEAIKRVVQCFATLSLAQDSSPHRFFVVYETSCKMTMAKAARIIEEEILSTGARVESSIPLAADVVERSTR